MTASEAKNIRDGLRFVTNTKGAKTGVLINLQNKQAKELFENFLDTLTILERQDEPTRPFEEVDAEILSMHNMKPVSCTK
jgi:hypothetical protein